MKARISFQMSGQQRKAMNTEINAQILEHDLAFSMDSDASVLWTLHEEFGFGRKRLRRFWEANLRNHNALREFYQFNDDDTFWLCRHNLKNIGVDIEQWYKEREGK